MINVVNSRTRTQCSETGRPSLRRNRANSTARQRAFCFVRNIDVENSLGLISRTIAAKDAVPLLVRILTVMGSARDTDECPTPCQYGGDAVVAKCDCAPSVAIVPHSCAHAPPRSRIIGSLPERVRIEDAWPGLERQHRDWRNRIL